MVDGFLKKHVDCEIEVYQHCIFNFILFTGARFTVQSLQTLQISGTYSPVKKLTLEEHPLFFFFLMLMLMWIMWIIEKMTNMMIV